MNFDPSEDEESLKALAERFVADRYDLDRRRAYRAEPAGFSTDNWKLLAELGLVAVMFETDAGGLGGDAGALATLFEALGKGLVVEPLLDNALLAGRLLAARARSPSATALLADVVSGRRRVALAHAEAGARGGRLWVEATARARSGAITLDGFKPFVAAGVGVDAYLVTARTAGAADDARGLGLYLVAAETPGLRRREWRLADGTAAVALELNNVEIGGEHDLGEVGDAIEQAETLASLARSAEALGIMRRLFDETLEYLRTRQQFGVALGSFQALQHRMVAQYAVIEQARGLLDLAVIRAGSAGFAHAVAGARAFIAPASLTLGHEMIQFHGAMGVTDELAIGHGHKRLLVLSRWPDGPEEALDRYAGIA